MACFNLSKCCWLQSDTLFSGGQDVTVVICSWLAADLMVWLQLSGEEVVKHFNASYILYLQYDNYFKHSGLCVYILCKHIGAPVWAITPQVLHLWLYCRLHVTSTKTFADTTTMWRSSIPLVSSWRGNNRKWMDGLKSYKEEPAPLFPLFLAFFLCSLFPSRDPVSLCHRVAFLMRTLYPWPSIHGDASINYIHKIWK